MRVFFIHHPPAKYVLMSGRLYTHIKMSLMLGNEVNWNTSAHNYQKAACAYCTIYILLYIPTPVQNACSENLKQLIFFLTWHTLEMQCCPYSFMHRLIFYCTDSYKLFLTFMWLTSNSSYTWWIKTLTRFCLKCTRVRIEIAAGKEVDFALYFSFYVCKVSPFHSFLRKQRKFALRTYWQSEISIRTSINVLSYLFLT